MKTRMASQLAAVSAVALLTFACSTGEPPAIEPSYDAKTGKLTELAYDSNHDGRPDTWTEMDGNRPLRSRVDRNQDGHVDRWEEYDANGALVKIALSRKDDGKPDTWVRSVGADGLLRVEVSSFSDEARIDRWESYASGGADGTGGALVRVDADTRGDGKPHKWETYRDGSLEAVSFDEDGDGVPDRRLTYRDSALAAIETKPDATGRFTVRTAIKSP